VQAQGEGVGRRKRRKIGQKRTRKELGCCLHEGCSILEGRGGQRGAGEGGSAVAEDLRQCGVRKGVGEPGRGNSKVAEADGRVSVSEKGEGKCCERRGGIGGPSEGPRGGVCRFSRYGAGLALGFGRPGASCMLPVGAGGGGRRGSLQCKCLKRASVQGRSGFDENGRVDSF